MSAIPQICWSELCWDLKLVGLITNNPHLLRTALASGVKPEYFGDDLARRTFEAMVALAEKVEPKGSDPGELCYALHPFMDTSSFQRLIELHPYMPVGDHMFEWFLEEFLTEAAERVAKQVPREDGEDQVSYSRRVLEAVSEVNSGARDQPTIQDVADLWTKKAEDTFLGKVPCTQTRFDALNGYINGFEPGALYVLGARPGIGKTALAINFAAHALEQGKRVIFATREMPTDQIFDRFVSYYSAINTQVIRKRTANGEQLDRLQNARDAIVKKPLDIFEKFGGYWEKLEGLVRREMTKHSVDLLVIDHLHIMKSSGKFESKRLTLTHITQSIKNAALEWKIPILLLSQLNREVERGRGDAGARVPNCSDLRDSGSIEEDADVVMFLHRVNSDDPTKSECFISIAKNRMGDSGRVHLSPRLDINRFSESVGRGIY
jgi:replicative DNA helicase